VTRERKAATGALPPEARRRRKPRPPLCAASLRHNPRASRVAVGLLRCGARAGALMRRGCVGKRLPAAPHERALWGLTRLALRRRCVAGGAPGGRGRGLPRRRRAAASALGDGRAGGSVRRSSTGPRPSPPRLGPLRRLRHLAPPAARRRRGRRLRLRAAAGRRPARPLRRTARNVRSADRRRAWSHAARAAAGRACACRRAASDVRRAARAAPGVCCRRCRVRRHQKGAADSAASCRARPGG